MFRSFVTRLEHLEKLGAPRPHPRVVVGHARRGSIPRRYRFAGGPASVVADVMTWPAITIRSGTRALIAERMAAEQGICHLPVIEGGLVMGILCVCDLAGAWVATLVSERLSRTVTTIAANEPLVRAAETMLEADVGCLPVILRGHLCGMLTRGDLVRARVLDRSLCPRCQECGTHHHVLRGPDRHGATLCRSCVAAVEARHRN